MEGEGFEMDPLLRLEPSQANELHELASMFQFLIGSVYGRY